MYTCRRLSTLYMLLMTCQWGGCSSFVLVSGGYWLLINAWVLTLLSVALRFGDLERNRCWFVRKSAKSVALSCVSVLSSVCMERLGSHGTDFHEIFNFCIFFEKSVEKIQVPLKYDENKGYFIWRPIFIFYHTPLSSWNEKLFRQKL